MRGAKLALTIHLAVFVIAVVAVGCGSPGESGDGTAPTADAGESGAGEDAELDEALEEAAGGEVELTPEELTPEALGTAFSTKEEGTLIVGSDIPFPPFEQYLDEDFVVGFEAEMVEEIALRLGNVDVVWVDTDFDTIFTQLAAGEFDIVLSATTITPERSAIVNFSTPYLLARLALAINAEETPEIASIGDLGDGDSVAVQGGRAAEAWARENLEPKGISVQSFPEAPDVYIALEAGEVTGVISDEGSAVDEVANQPALEIADIIDTGQSKGLAVDPSREELLASLNVHLQEIVEDGTYQDIYDSWFVSANGSITGTGGGAEPSTSDEAAPGEEDDALANSETLGLAADIDGTPAYDTDTLEASAGEITIIMENLSATPHNIAVEGQGIEPVLGEIVTEADSVITLTLEPGTYTFFSSVPGDREAGMVGTLTVG